MRNLGLLFFFYFYVVRFFKFLMILFVKQPGHFCAIIYRLVYHRLMACLDLCGNVVRKCCMKWINLKASLDFFLHSGNEPNNVTSSL